MACVKRPLAPPAAVGSVGVVGGTHRTRQPTLTLNPTGGWVRGNLALPVARLTQTQLPVCHIRPADPYRNSE